MNQGRDLSRTKETITDLAVKEAAAKPVTPGTVLLSFKLSIGKVGIARRAMFTNEAIAALPVRDGSRLLPDYLCLALASMDLTGGANRAAMGATLNKAKLQQLRVPLPPLVDQRRIAAILDQADALLTKRREALAHLDDLTQSIFLDMFGDPGSNPRGYELRRLGEVLKFKSGNFLPASKMQAGAHAVLGGNGITGWHDEYLFEDPQLVIGRVGVYCGCVHISPAQSWITDNALYVSERPPGLSLTYLGYAIEQANLNQYASQSAQPLISASRINPVAILVPPLTVQEDFGTVVSATDVVRQKMGASAAQLDGLFSSLQSRAFAGEL